MALVLIICLIFIGTVSASEVAVDNNDNAKNSNLYLKKDISVNNSKNTHSSSILTNADDNLKENLTREVTNNTLISNKDKLGDRGYSSSHSTLKDSKLLNNDLILNLCSQNDGLDLIGKTNQTTYTEEYPDDSFTALQNLVNDYSWGTLILNRNYQYYPEYDSLYGAGITIVSAINIIGNNYTIDGKNQARMFDVYGSDVVLDNIRFVNGRSSSGGVIYWQGMSGSINNCLFMNNVATTSAGAIYMYDGEVTISNSKFINNIASNYGGAIYWYSSDGHVINSTFSNNTASNQGGAIYWSGSYGAVENSTFSDNSATNYGGALYWSGSRGQVDSSIFSKNTVTSTSTSSGGGAIYTNQQNFIVSGSIFTDMNYQYYQDYDAAFVEGILISKNITILGNGYNSDVNEDDKQSEISLNDNSKNKNPSILLKKDNADLDKNKTVNNDKILTSSFNDGKYGAGEPEDSFTALRNLIYSDTTGTVNLDKNYNYYSSYDSSYSGGIEINKQIRINGNGFTIDAKNQARVFKITADKVTIDDITFDHGSSDYGGAVYVDGNEVTVANCIFKNSVASANAGALYISNLANNNTVVNSSFLSNSAPLYGGGVSCYGRYIKFLNSTFMNNRLTGSSTVEGYGSALNCPVNNALIDGCKFIGHKGSPLIYGTINFSSSHGIITNCFFKDNSALYGAGVRVYSTLTNITIYGCTFVNLTSSHGGAITMAAPDSKVIKCNFINNTASNSNAGHGGGALYWNGANGYLADCNFTGNKVNLRYGGAVHWVSINGQIINSTFTKNTALEDYAGALYVVANNTVVNKCRFIENNAKNFGGAISWGGSYGLLNDSVFINNVLGISGSITESNGGAVYWQSAGANQNNPSVISYCNFSNNTATWGGAVYLDTNAHMLVTKSNFVNNTADYGGSGINSNAKTIRVTDSTFIKNNVIGTGTNRGGTLRFGTSSTSYSDYSVKNCSFISNYAAGSAAGVLVVNGAHKIYGCLFYDNYAVSGPVMYSYYTGTAYLSDSVILNNRIGSASSYYVSSNTDNYKIVANNNWWGNTLQNANTKIPAHNSNRVTITSWHYLDITAAPGFIRIDDLTNITFSLNKYATATTTADRTFAYTMPIDFNISSTLGNLSSNNLTLNPTNMKAVVGYNGSDVGVGTVTAMHLTVTGTFRGIYIVPDDSFSALNITIANNDGDVLNLTHNYKYYDDFDFTLIYGMLIKRSITINGNGFILDARKKTRIFNITANNVILNNLVFINGSTNGYGGAVYSTSGYQNITFINSKFINNSATGNGGAANIYSDYNAFINTTFENNRITGTGSTYGSAINLVGDYSIIDGCIFKNHSAGGTVYGTVNFSSQEGILCNSTFINNKAYHGGVARIYSTYSNINVYNITAIGNTANYGGAIYMSSINSTIYDSVFINNTAITSGSAIYCSGINAIINNSVFINNSAIYATVYFTSSGSGNNNPAMISYCNFTDNRGEWGGALNLADGNSYVLITKSNFIRNYALYTGSAIVSRTNYIRITDSNFISNFVPTESSTSNLGGTIRLNSTSVYDYTVKNCSFISNSAYRAAGILVSGGAHKIVGCFIYNNSATAGTVMYSFYAGTASISDSVIYGNKVGSASYFVSSYSDSYKITANYNWWGNTLDNANTKIPAHNVNRVTINNWHYLDITVNPKYIRIGDLTNVTFSLNKYATSSNKYSRNFVYTMPIDLNITATLGNLSSDSVTLSSINMKAFALYNATAFGLGNITAKHLSFTGNYRSVYVVPNGSFMELNITIAKHNGNVLNLTHNYTYNALFDSPLVIRGIEINKDIIINGNGFTLNALNQLRVFNITHDNVKLDNMTFINGKCDFGGVIYIDTDNVTIANSMFYNNVATSNAGAIYISNQVVNATIINSTFIANSAPLYGGAISAYGSYIKYINLTFINNTLTGDSTANGYGTALNSPTSYSLVDRCKFIGHKGTPKIFGTINFSSNHGIMTNCVLENNEGRFGAGVRVYDVTNVTISGCNFTNMSSAHGGAITMAGTNSKVIKCIFINNTATSDNTNYGGGALYWNGANGNVSDCIFIGNKVNTKDGGALFWDAANGYISNSVFIGNTAPLNDGGAINAEITASNLRIYNITVKNNVARDLGSAIKCYADGLKVYDSTFIGNNDTTGSYGGAFYTNGTGEITNCTFINNKNYKGGAILAESGITLSIYDSKFINNSVRVSTQFGGAIRMTGTLKVYNSEFINNTGNRGGAVYTTSKSATFDNCTFTYNNATAYGGAIFADYGASIINSNFTKNYATNNGGAVFIQGSTGSIKGSYFIGNYAYRGAAIASALRTDVDGSLFVNNYASNDAGVYYSVGTGSIVKNSIIINNTAGSTNNDIKIFNYGSSGTATVFTLNNNWWGNNVTNYNIKPVILTSRVVLNQWLYMESTSNVTDLFVNETISIKFSLSKWYNSVNRNTGAFTDMASLPSATFYITPYLGNSTRKAQLINGIVNINFTASEIGNASVTASYNVAKHTHFFRIIPSDSFSALQKLINENTNGTLSLTHGYHYYADWDAHLINGVKVNKTINIIGLNTTLDAENQARIFEVTGVNVIIDNITFVKGFANGTGNDINGGAIYWTGASGILANSTFVNNTAAHTGGAIRWTGTNGKLINSVFENNIVIDSAGGAIYWQGTNGLIDSSNFTNNSAPAAGAIHIDSNAASNTITNSLFVKNYASNNAGAVYNNRASNIIKDSTFIDNEAKDGGAIYVGGSSIQLNNLVLINNTASDYGGAVYVYGSSAVISSSVIMKNKANFGGAIYVANSGTNFLMKDSVLYQNIGYDAKIVSAPDGSSNLGTLNFNWWGNEENNLKEKPVVSDRFIISNWLYLTVAGNESVIEVNQSEKITVTLTKLANADGDLGTTYTLPIVNFTLTAVNGNLTKDSISMASGSNNFVYTAIKTGNNSVVGKFYEFEFEFPLSVFTTDSFTALQNIIDTNVGGVVNLTRDYRYYDDLDKHLIGGIYINKTITIIGNGYSINGLGKAAIFNVEASNVVADNITFVNGTVYWKGQNGKLNNGLINSSTIDIAAGANLNITKGTQTNDALDYVIINRGSIHLSNNNFTSPIYNLGTITSSVTAIVLNNKTIEVSPRIINITAVVYDDNKNVIRDDRYAFYVDNVTYEPKFTIDHYIASNYFVNFGNHTVTSYFTNALACTNVTYKNALIVGEPKKDVIANITVNVTDDGKVIIKANVTPSDLDGNITLYVGGDTYTLEFINGTGNFTLEKLPADEYNMIVYYPGDDLHNSYISNVNFTIELIPSQINITFTDYYVGDDVIVVINLTNGTTGLPTIYVDNKKVTYTNLSSVNLGKLAYGNHTISVFYAGDKYYDSSVNITSFMVQKRNVTISVNVSDITADLSEFINISVSDNATGQVLVNINGTKYLLDLIDSKVNLTLNNLKEGIYNVNITYLGDSKYNNSTFNTAFRVTKLNSTLIITTNNGVSGGIVVLNITLPYNATGVVKIKVNSSSYVVAIVNGTSILELRDLTTGNYTVVATYDGDDVYANVSNTTRFSVVDKQLSNITLDEANFTVNVPTTVNITTNFQSGLVDVYIDGVKQVSVNVDDFKGTVNIKGLSAGNHTLMFVYAGNANFTNVTVVENITVLKLNSTVNVSVDDIYVGNRITVNVNASGNGTATITLFNATKIIGTYNVVINNQKGSIIVPYVFNNNGTYTVNVTYNGDDIYFASVNSTTFDVLNMTVANITVEDVNYTVMVPTTVNITTNFNGLVEVYIDGVKQASVNVADFKGTVNVKGLSAGNHTLMFVYAGNSSFTGITVIKNITVGKRNSTVKVTTQDIESGEMITVNVTASGNGSATLILFNSTGIIGTYNLLITNCSGSIIVPYVFNYVGNYKINVTYNGDDVYLPSNNHTSFDVTAAIDYDFKVITNTALVGETAIVNVTLPGNANSDVILTLPNGTNLTVKANDGVAVFTINGLPYGNYTLNATYVGDNNYQRATKQGKLSILKHDALVNLTCDIKDFNATGQIIGSVTAGGKVNMTVHLPNDATGNVTVYLNNHVIGENIVVNDGKVIVELKDYFTSGINVVNVTYTGDDKYYNSTVVNYIFASAYATHLNVTVENNTYIVGSDVKLNISTNAQGNLTIYVNSHLIETITINGDTIYTLNNVTAGEALVMVVFHPNDNFTGVFNTTNFTVIKKNTTIGIDVVGNSASLPVTVIVTFDKNVTGWVDAYVNGTTPQTARSLILNNQVTFVFYGLEVGKHNVTIAYEGNDIYNGGNNSKMFTIDKSSYYLMNVTVEDVHVGDNAYVIVQLPAGATGLINITLQGQHFTGILQNATVNITIPSSALTTEGKYNIIVAYNGSDSLNASSVAASFNVIKVSNYPININVTDIKFGEIEIINITMPSDINNTVIKVLINDVEYNATVIDGKASLTLTNLTVGSKTVKVVFNGNNRYVPLNATDKFVVSQANVLLNVSVSVGITNATVYVTANPNINETVRVYVAGRNKTITLLDGKGNVEFDNLAAGNYTAIVIFDATENYVGITNQTDFTLNKQDFNIDIVVENNVLYVGGNNTITITYTAVKSTDLNITVNGKNVPLVITPNGDNNTVTIALTDLAEGKYDILVKYTGDEYNLANASKTFNVYKYDVIASESIIIWNNANVTVTMPNNASGIVTVTVGGKSYNKTINSGVAIIEVPGLTVGTHTLVVSYTNDTYFGEFSVNKVVSVVPTSDYNLIINNPINPEIGVNNNITVILPENATGKVAVYLDGNLLENASLVAGKAVISVLGNLLTDGNHTVRAIYYGDVNYTASENNTKFTLNKQNISLDIDVDNVTVVDEIVVTVTTNMTNADGGLVINIGGTNYTANIKNNVASITVNALPYGDYNISVYYNGNNKYNAANATAKFNVAKLNTTIVATVVENVINITVDARASGIVYVEFKGKNYTGIIYKGNATIVLPVDNGKFDLTVRYDGDEKFNANSTPIEVVMHNEGNYTINTTIADPVIATANNITVTLPANATGNVSVYLDGVLLTTAPLSEGKLVVPVSANLMTAGNHTIRTVYAGDTNYIAGENTTSFTITKKAFTIDLSVSNIKVGDVEVITVNIPEDATGVVLLDVNGVKYYVNVVNGTGSINITKLTNGTYSVVAEYGEDDLYNASNTTKQFNVTKVTTYDMNVTYAEVVNNATKVTVTLPDDATGLVTLIVNGTNFTGVIYKGKATIDVNNLTGQKYTYVAIWEGDDKYVNGSATGIIYNDAFREKSQVIVSVDDIFVDGAALIKINVTDGATGNVRITVNGKNIIVPLTNSSTTYKLTGLANGTYDVNVTYLGDRVYAESINSTTFKVSKLNSTIMINVTEGKAGESITVTITGSSDASGIVEVLINGTAHNVVMSNGEAVFVTTFDKYGQYNITANYAGNNKYNPSSNSSTFVINAVSPSIVVSADDIKVGQNATIIVTVPSDATGVVTIIVNGNYYNATIDAGKATFNVPNLANGTYNVVANYAGDSKYEGNANSTAFNVTKVDIVPDISSTLIVEQKTNITVRVPTDATGTITIFVGNNNFTAPITGGVAHFNLNNVVNGTDVTFVYDGDDKYNGFNTSAILYDAGIKLSSSLSILISNIRVGDNATITVGVTAKATGNITIKIGDKILSKEIVGGTVTFTVSDLAYGTYNVTATYDGDSKFLGSNITSSISVSKYDSVVIVSVVDIKVGENATIIVAVPGDASGNVTIKLNGVDQDPAMVSGGQAVFVISNLGNGTYEVVATYNGDAKYLNSIGNATFKVSKIDINPNIDSTSVLDNKTNVTVIVPSDATGNITIVVGANEFTAPIDGGKAVLNISGVGDGTNITIIYNGDDKYNGFNATAVVTDKGVRINPAVVVVTDKDEYLAGETAVITITVPEDARGNVTIKINGAIITTENITEGKVIYNYTIPASGTFNVEVIYNGDNKYGKASNTTSFNASKVRPTVIIEVNSTPVGQNVTIVVYVPIDAEGQVNVIVDSIPHSAFVKDGKAEVNVSGLAKGNYTVQAMFTPSDAKYDGNANSTTFEVTANPAPLVVVVNPITYGEDAKIIVKVPGNATGYVTITIGDDTYLANIGSGEAKFTISGLEPGIINMEIAYSGDDGYLENTTNANITVNLKSTAIDVIANDIDKGDVAVISVVVSKDATGVVVITVDGKDYNTTLSGGIASFSISGLNAGTYNIVAKYLGDKYYANATNDTVLFNVLTDSSIITTVVTRAYGSDYDYEAIFTDKAGKPLANTNVTFAVNGKEYYAITDENGVAKLPGGTLSVGNHTVVAINPVTGYETHNTTEILPRLVNNKDISMDFKDGSKYSVRVIGDDGKPVGEGVEVTIKVNTVAYKVKTDKDGYARLSINLNPGSYTVEASQNGYKVSNNLKVKQTLSAKKTQVAKKSAKVSKIKATLKWSSGKGINGKKVTMKFRGKVYSAKTNSKGIATFKLPKKAIKKLKAGRTYKVRFTYLTNSIYKYIKIKK